MAPTRKHSRHDDGQERSVVIESTCYFNRLVSLYQRNALGAWGAESAEIFPSQSKDRLYAFLFLNTGPFLKNTLKKKKKRFVVAFDIT